MKAARVFDRNRLSEQGPRFGSVARSMRAEREAEQIEGIVVSRRPQPPALRELLLGVFRPAAFEQGVAERGVIEGVRRIQPCRLPGGDASAIDVPQWRLRDEQPRRERLPPAKRPWGQF